MAKHCGVRSSPKVLSHGQAATRPPAAPATARGSVSVQERYSDDQSLRCCPHDLLALRALVNVAVEHPVEYVEEWAKRQRSLSKDEALGTLALRYFRSHGPVTQQDFMGWTGLSAAEAKRRIAVVERQLASFDYAGKVMWMQKSLFDEAARLPKDESPRVHVLPGFDEYLLGIKDRSIAVPATHKNKIIPGGNGMFMPTMVADGVVVGTWKRRLKKSVVAIQPLPFRPLRRSLCSEFDAAFAAYARHLGVEAKLEWK